MKRLLFFTFVAMLYCNYVLSSMQINNSEFPSLVIVPGQNGSIGLSAQKFIELLQPQELLRYEVQTPLHIPDFGQQQCMDYLDTVLTFIPQNEQSNYILFATSQGTATSINSFNALHDKPRPKALLLQSVMLSGNSAIQHTVTHMMEPSVATLPGHYYWLPYVAKCSQYPWYAPAGDQPLYNIDKIPTNLPIIIIHCTNDRQLSFKDAQALYAKLKNTGNANVYLFEMPNSDGDVNHFVNFDAKTTSAIFSILEKHKVLDGEKWNHYKQSKNITTVSDLSAYQPEIKHEWLVCFNTMVKQEKKIACFDGILKIALIGLALSCFL